MGRRDAPDRDGHEQDRPRCKKRPAARGRGEGDCPEGVRYPKSSGILLCCGL
jgi:hypothetical protein